MHEEAKTRVHECPEAVLWHMEGGLCDQSRLQSPHFIERMLLKVQTEMRLFL